MLTVKIGCIIAILKGLLFRALVSEQICEKELLAEAETATELDALLPAILDRVFKDEL